MTEEDVEPKYQFEQMFWVAAGEKALVGDGVEFFLKELKYISDTSVYRIEYTLTKDGNEYNGYAFLEENAVADFYPDVYNPYRIRFIEVERGEENLTAGFRISDVKEAPDAMTVSGKESDTYTTTDYEYVVGEKCILYLDKDVTFQGNIIQVIECVMDGIEEETGYKFYVDNKYSGVRTDGIRELYYGSNPWPGVDEFNEKIAVYIVNRPDEYFMSCAFERAVVITYFDFDLETEGVYAMAHELTHTILMRNAESLNTKLSEGYAFLIGSRVAEKFPEYPLTDMALEQSYGKFPFPLDASNAEGIFMTEYDDYVADFKNYQYGVYFMTYILESYGNGGFHDFISCLNQKNEDNYVSPTDEMIVEALKETFSDTVFEDFGNWYAQNKSRFTDEE